MIAAPTASNVQVVERIISYAPRGRAAEKFYVVLPPGGDLGIGTGLNFLFSEIPLKKASLGLLSLSKALSTEAPISIPVALKKVRDQLHLNMSELAQMFAVSRPTAYAWINGVEPRPNVLGEIWQALALAERISSLELTNQRLAIRQPIRSQPSVVSCLLQRRGVEAAVERLKTSALTSKPKVVNPNRQRKQVYTAEDISSVVHGLE